MYLPEMISMFADVLVFLMVERLEQAVQQQELVMTRNKLKNELEKPYKENTELADR